MKRLRSYSIWIVLIFTFGSIRISAQTELKRNNLFDFNWRFHKGGAQGAEIPSFDDSKWRVVDIPHDWSIEDLPATIYSSCGQVDLLLNGKSLGEETTDRSTKYSANWKVPYEPGTIRAVGYTGKKQVAVVELHSAGKASQIKLSADRNRIAANGQDLSYITVELADNSGVRDPKAENQVSFEVNGPGTIEGVGNANPVSLESFIVKQLLILSLENDLLN
jgi:beta-galactosidase